MSNASGRVLRTRGMSQPNTARGMSVPETARGMSVPETASGVSVPETARGMSEPETVPLVTPERAEQLVGELSQVLEELRIAVSALVAERERPSGWREEDPVPTLVLPDPEPPTGVYSVESLRAASRRV